MSKRSFLFLNRNQTRRFVLFFLAASFVWFINNLNETHSVVVRFDLKYENEEQKFILPNDLPQELRMTLRASGFKLLSFSMFKPTLKLYTRDAILNDQSKYVLNERILQSQFSNQIGKGIVVDDYHSGDLLAIEFDQLAEKKVPIILKSELQTAPNYYLKSLTLALDSVVVKSAAEKLSSIGYLETENLALMNLNRSLDTVLSLHLAKAEGPLKLFPSSVKASIEVGVFSEKSFTVPVQAKDLPLGYGVKFFPSELTVIVAAPINVLKAVRAEDIALLVSYPFKISNSAAVLKPRIQLSNNSIIKAYLSEDQGVEYVVTKKN